MHIQHRKMNNSTYIENKTYSVGNLNRNYASNHLVYILFLSVMSVVGIFGNILVILVYGCKQKRNTYTTIVIGLATSDTLVSSITIPIQVLEKLNHFSFFSPVTCKIWLCFCYFVVVLSALTILILSADRYKRICTPFKAQYTPKYAMLLCLGACCFSALVCWPHALIWDTQQFKADYNLTVHVCISEHYSNTVFPMLFNCFIMLLLVTIVTTLIVVYGLIWRKMYTHSKYRKKFTHPTPSSNVSDRNELPQSVPYQTATLKITKIAFTIVIVFIASYLPSSTMKLLDTIGEWDIHDRDTVNSCVLKAMARSSYCFNHMANPFIYTFMDSKFRNDVKSFIGGVCCYRSKTKT